jgi:hypothetical protein
MLPHPICLPAPLHDLYVEKLLLGGCTRRLVLEPIRMILLAELQVGGLQYKCVAA